MRLRYIFASAALALAGLPFLTAQQQGKIEDVIVGYGKTRIAVPDFRGKGTAQALMGVFNETVWNDLADAGILSLVPKTSYPLEVPQSPAEFRAPVNGQRAGMWLTDWSRTPVETNYLGIGSVDVNGADMVLRGSLLNVGLADVQSASLFSGNAYFGPVSDAGARKIAHEYAADILKQLGVMSLAGSRIYFVSDRTGKQEVWSMDHDGQNQRQMTRHGSYLRAPAVSPDGKLVAYAVMVTGENAGWQIRVIDAETGRQKVFVNPVTSVLSSPEFSPDGTKLWFSMAVNDWQQVMVANLDGSGRQRISNVRAIETAPRVNPKNASEVLFISGRTGKPQLYKMGAAGEGVEIVTTNEGDVANPAWSPNGKLMAFSWTRGYVPGEFNVFIMDVAKKQFVQLTKESGSNENPWWAPDGAHLVYSNKRGSSTQIYTMLADGTRVKQLTTAGNNTQPVWAAKIN